jgi:acetoin utilization protein AcuB
MGETVGIAVMNIMTTPVWTLQGSERLRAAFGLMERRHIRHVPVLRGDRLIGILSDRDLHVYLPPPVPFAGMGNYAALLDRVRVEEAMTSDLVSIGPYHGVTEAARLMLERRVGALPVVDEGKVIGIVTQTDILWALANLLEQRPLEAVPAEYPTP